MKKKPPPLVTFDQVTLRIQGEDVFHQVRWQFHPGEQWAVIGPNNAGKTLFLQAMLGNIPVSSGEIYYQLDPAATPDWIYPETAIAHVSLDEHRALLTAALAYHQARWSSMEDTPPCFVRDVLSSAYAHASKTIWDDAIHLLGIEYLMNRALETLSNGEMRKVLIARALFTNPRLLLLDNPFAGLDADSRKHLRMLLNILMKRGIAIMLTAQRPDEIPSGITHLLGIENRQILFQGAKRKWIHTQEFEHLLNQANTPTTFPRITWAASKKKPSAFSSHPPVIIANTSVVYDSVIILDNIQWTIQPGEKWVLCGPNGAGKSTLLSLIMGDNPQAYSNDIRLFGRQRGSGESIWEIKKHIGWLAPELHYFYDDDATVYEVVCSGLHDTIGVYRTNSSHEIRQVRKWLSNLGILDYKDEPFASLSDGRQRMVLFARALVKEPPLLIFDEPCQGLDALHRAMVLDVLQQLAQIPTATIIYVTHHDEDIPASFTHTLQLNKGCIR